MISEGYRERKDYSDVSDEEVESCDSYEPTIREQIQEEIQQFTERLLSKKEDQFLSCLKRIDKSLAAIQLHMRSANSNAKPPAAAGAKASPADHRIDYTPYADLPIPMLTLDRDYQKWFTLYEQVMATRDEKILKRCLAWYLDEKVLDLYVEVSGKSYRNIKKCLQEKIDAYYDEEEYEEEYYEEDYQA